jgi:DNA-directed RNA polymerase omega subunit
MNESIINIDECLAHAENRFDLIIMATKRVYELISDPSLCNFNLNDQDDNVKLTYIALQEIALGYIKKTK